MKFDIQPVRGDINFTALPSSPPPKGSTLRNHPSPSNLKLHFPELYQRIAKIKQSTIMPSEAEEYRHI
jgi:hypothetical protein